MGITDLAQRARPSRALWFACVTTACMPFAQSPLPGKGPPPIAELVEPNPRIESRDLFYGAGGKEFAPRADVEYRFLEKDTSGFSDNYEIEDPHGRRYDAKFGVEARAEVVASRLLWAIGFYQRALQSHPDDAQGWYHLGYALKERGKKREAADAFKNYLAKAPDAKDKKDIEDEIYYLSK